MPSVSAESFPAPPPSRRASASSWPTLSRAASKVLLVIDEAQGLGDELLRKVFDLSTIGTFEEHPFAILLAGQRELSAALSKDQHAGLRQRITTTCVLEPLTADEVGEYIRSRLRTAGSEEAIFAPDAVRQIASVSRGAPGLINVVCERALLAGYQRQARPIGPEIIDACLGGLGLGDDGRWSAETKWPRRARLRGPRSSRGVGAPDSERRSRSSCWAWPSSASAATRCTWGGSAGRRPRGPVVDGGCPRQTRRGRGRPGRCRGSPRRRGRAKEASPDKAEPSPRGDRRGLINLGAGAAG